MRFFSGFFIILTLLALCFLSSVGCTDSTASSPIISMVGGIESMGSDGELIDHQVLTYHWQIKNNSSQEVLLQWVQPNLSAELTSRLLTEDVRINMGKVIEPRGTIEVGGTITFDSAGLSKQEIIEKCYITDMTVSIESTVNMTGKRTI